VTPLGPSVVALDSSIANRPRLVWAIGGVAFFGAAGGGIRRCQLRGGANAPGFDLMLDNHLNAISRGLWNREAWSAIDVRRSRSRLLCSIVLGASAC